ncbi:UvrD-helicase domain-containing protein [Kribbia dieselivorans]|uniref:UvrD-helicase domain-containing protein n=1 Tax=Kribbia dieselivorans TaxID=331526 RepID=UPI0008392BFD|nr:UvrD-helicase domain-containing protein [Kribbia dieselivorans]
MTATQDELSLEQEYFDAALAAREAHRATLLNAGSAAGGSTKNQAAIARNAKAAAEKLGEPDSEVAFGKLTFTDDDEPLYIGKRAIFSEDKDLLVISWQRPAAQAYYNATAKDPLGVAVKRAFDLTGNRITTYEDTVFVELAERISELTAEERWGVNDALLTDLQARRDGAMHDIAKTIQHAQYELITQPLERLLIIQGGPGTGKTAVALHRVSWLLANHPELAEDGVLVIGPSPTFTRYIRKVLPELGDVDVDHRDLRSLGPFRAERAAESRETAALKGQAKMARLIAQALRDRVRVPAGVESLRVGGLTGPAIDRDEVQAQLDLARQRPTYAGGRLVFRQWLQQAAQDRARRGLTITAGDVDAATERIWPSMTPQVLLRDLLSSRERLLNAASSEFSATDITALQRTPTARVTEQFWTDADIALLDEADTLINGGPRQYQHIVVDEAQDLSPMQVRSIRRRSVDGSMTVVGDIAQATSPWAPDDWAALAEDLRVDHPAQVHELDLGYRVPRQIYQHAANLLKHAAPGVTPPRVVREGPADVEFLTTSEHVSESVAAAREHASKGRFVGMICAPQDHAEIAAALTADDIRWGDVGRGEMDVAINLATAQESKGLEFDAVVIVNPSNIVAGAEHGLRLLYIAMTRSTAYLTVVHNKEVLPTAEQAVDNLEQVPITTVSDTPPGARLVAAALRGEGASVSTPVVDDAPEIVMTRAGRHGRSGAADPSIAEELSERMSAEAAQFLAGTLAATVLPQQWARVIELLPTYLPRVED